MRENLINILLQRSISCRYISHPSCLAQLAKYVLHAPSSAIGSWSFLPELKRSVLVRKSSSSSAAVHRDDTPRYLPTWLLSRVHSIAMCTHESGESIGVKVADGAMSSHAFSRFFRLGARLPPSLSSFRSFIPSWSRTELFFSLPRTYLATIDCSFGLDHSRIQSASRKVDLGFWLFGNARKNRGECTILVPVDARSIDRRFSKACYPRNFQFPSLLRAFPRGTLAQLCLIGQDSSDVFSISFKVKSRTCLFIAKRFRVDFSLPHEGEGNCCDETGFLRVSWNETQCLYL